MKGFHFDIETRLDKAYKNGAGQKFGINELSTPSARSENGSITAKDIKDLDLKSDISGDTLSRLNSKTTASDTSKTTAAGQSALKPKMPKAKPKV